MKDGIVTKEKNINGKLGEAKFIVDIMLLALSPAEKKKALERLLKLTEE